MHALRCSIGGLVITCHKEICDELLYLYRSAFNSAYVRSKPLIYQGFTRSEQEIRQGSDKHQDTQGGVMVCGLWDSQFDSIIDFNIGDADADTYKYAPMSLLLARWENIKKDKHGKHYHDQQNCFGHYFFKWTEC